MKREAGVVDHAVNRTHEDLSGLAWLDTGHIRSPQGRNMAQLYILAHECGHIFLHGRGPGRHLPTHVMEMEAESYAHQAFRVHGMEPPRRMTLAGRHYVGSWIAADRARGIPIDPRAETYAAGQRSPYEPLRAVPAAWRVDQADSRHRSRPLRAWRPRLSIRAHISGWLDFIWDQFVTGFTTSIVLWVFFKEFRELTDIFARGIPSVVLPCAMVALIYACVASAIRAHWLRR